MDGDDCFDRLPDPILLLIFNGVKDIKSLIRFKAVSTRFNTLVPQTETLCLRVDRVVSANESDESLFSGFIKSVFKPLFDMVIGKGMGVGGPDGGRNSPVRILHGFERVRSLEIELPAGDLNLEKGAAIRWSAEFGKSLRSCVILGFRSSAGGEVDLGGGGLKTRVVWTISALIAASARHYMAKELLKEHKDLERLVVRDREGEGTVVMERDGLRECRERSEEGEEEERDGAAEVCGGNSIWWRSNRTTVPAVRMRMRHEPKMELCGGERMEGATLVVVRPAGDVETENEEKLSGKNRGPSFEAFNGFYGEAVEKLLKSRSYLLEMNSF